jgi:hypothetical protein
MRSSLLQIFSAALALSVQGGVAEEKRSPGKEELEASEAQLIVEDFARENQSLKSKLHEGEATIAALQKNLATATSEAEVFRRKAAELNLRLEALGLDAAGSSSGKLEQRLLAAVSDLKVVEDERKRLQEALIQLSEAVLRYEKATVSNDPEARLSLEAGMRRAGQALGIAPPQSVEAAAVSSTLADGMVISYKKELALVVTNIGARHGVKVGMPFQVLRGKNLIGTIRMVDVREKIAGAVIQNLNSEKETIKVGDRVKVDARP